MVSILTILDHHNIRKCIMYILYSFRYEKNGKYFKRPKICLIFMKDYEAEEIIAAIHFRPEPAGKLNAIHMTLYRI